MYLRKYKRQWWNKKAMIKKNTKKRSPFGACAFYKSLETCWTCSPAFWRVRDWLHPFQCAKDVCLEYRVTVCLHPPYPTPGAFPSAYSRWLRDSQDLWMLDNWSQRPFKKEEMELCRKRNWRNCIDQHGGKSLSGLSGLGPARPT